MPLEFCVGLSTFGFQFLASCARVLLLLCGSVLAGVEQVFGVLSQLKFRQGQKKQPFTPAETKSSLCHHAFCRKNLVRPPILRPELVSLEELQSSPLANELSAR